MITCTQLRFIVNGYCNCNLTVLLLCSWINQICIWKYLQIDTTSKNEPLEMVWKTSLMTKCTKNYYLCANLSNFTINDCFKEIWQFWTAAAACSMVMNYMSMRVYYLSWNVLGMFLLDHLGQLWKFIHIYEAAILYQFWVDLNFQVSYI